MGIFVLRNALGGGRAVKDSARSYLNARGRGAVMEDRGGEFPIVAEGDFESGLERQLRHNTTLAVTHMSKCYRYFRTAALFHLLIPRCRTHRLKRLYT